jgi:hypothetical protein
MSKRKSKHEKPINKIYKYDDLINKTNKIYYTSKIFKITEKDLLNIK